MTQCIEWQLKPNELLALEILDQTNPPEGNKFKYQTNWMALREDLYLSPSRVYSGELGRFLQSDPLPVAQEREKLLIYENSVFALEILGSPVWGNLYSYVFNSPLEFLDYLGLSGANQIV